MQPQHPQSRRADSTLQNTTIATNHDLHSGSGVVEKEGRAVWVFGSFGHFGHLDVVGCWGCIDGCWWVLRVYCWVLVGVVGVLVDVGRY